MSEPLHIPLFPLNTVLLPGSFLPLRIFEPRYVNMVSRSLKNDTGFGVVLIREGSEVGEAASGYAVGTLAKIRDFDHLPDGLLGITVQGIQRFYVESVAVETDMLSMAEAVLLDEAVVPVPSEYDYLKEYLYELLNSENIDISDSLVEKAADAAWLGYRLADLLPMSMLDKQRLLEENDPLQRFNMLKQYFS